MKLSFGAFLVGATTMLTAGEAHALGPLDLEAGLRAGVATKPADADPTPFGFGLGGRAGVNLFDHYYLGLSAIHYFGGSASNAGFEVSSASTLVGAELGYTITALPLIRIRPQLGAGLARLSADIEGPGASGVGAFSFPGSVDKLYLEPGVLVYIPIALFFVGADVNALIVPDAGNTTYAAFTAHAQFGLRL